MKLLFCLNHYFPFGGLERDCLRIAKACAEKGHTIEIITQSWEGPQPDNIIVHCKSGFAFTHYGRQLKFFFAVKKFLQQHHFDAVIGFNKMPGLDIYYAADVCFHEKFSKMNFLKWLNPKNWVYLALERSVFSPRAKTQILVLTPQQQATFSRFYRTQQERFHLVAPNIDPRYDVTYTEEMRAQLRHKMGIAENQKIILFVASFFKTKGLDRALLALASLPDNIRHTTQLWVIGQDDTAIYQKQAQQLGIISYVKFLGARDNVPDYMFAADVLLHPAYVEAAGLVLVEALAAGLPVITTAVCGYASHVQESDASVVVPEPFAQQQLNQALVKVLSSDLLVCREKAIFFSCHPRASEDPGNVHDCITNLLDSRARANDNYGAQDVAPSLSYPIHKTLRVLPGKRWVIQSTWQNKPVVIKIFSSSRAAKRAINSIYELQARGILMPQLYEVTTDMTGNFTCLIFEELPHVSLIEQALQYPVEICKKLISVVARQHELGVIQGDMHLNNFIMMDEAIYTIDTDKIICQKDPVSIKASHKSLAQLVVQFFPEVKKNLNELYQFYCQQRHWHVKDHAFKNFQREVNNFAAYRQKKFLAKLFRARRSVYAEQTFLQRAFWLKAVDTPAFRALVQDPDKFFTAKDAHFLKKGNSRTVIKLEIDGQAYVVKRYNLKDKCYAISRLMRASRAAHAWKMAHLFQFLHIPTVPPVALIEKRWGPLRREAYLVTKYLEGEVLSDLTLSPEALAKIKTQALAQIAKMHAENITHGDLKLANILVSHGQTLIIDVDSTRYEHFFFNKKRRINKDNARFLAETMQAFTGESASS